MAGLRIDVLTATLAVFAADASAGQIAGISNFQVVARLTGTPSQNNTVSSMNIGGTDLGLTVNHDGKTYFLFGDTFSGANPSVGGNWRRNAMAWTADTNPSDGFVFQDWLKDPGTGYAKQVFTNNDPAGSGVITNIPTGAISTNGNLFAWFMNVNQWGPGNGEWYISQAQLAKWGGGNNGFSIVSSNTFPSNTNFGMVAAREGVNGDPYIYLWGTPAGRFGGVKLARFLPAQIENQSAYQYYNGTVGGVPQWTNDEFAGDFVVSGTVGEMSVMYNQAVGAWTMMYFNESNGRFEIRQADTPWGTWSAPITVMTQAQSPAGTGGIYAPYMNPLWVEDGGRTIYFTMSLWVPYDVYLAKATLNIIPEPASLMLLAAAAPLLLMRRRNLRVLDKTRCSEISSL